MTADRLRMTPGPTEVPAAVRERMSEPTPNPDVEPEFFEFYRTLIDKLEPIYGDDDIAILGGEGILGLEAAIASLVEPGDRVLCIANGRYGEGFADFVEMYDGEAAVCATSWQDPLDLATIESHLADGSFDVATMVHCETPTGVLNDIEPVLDALEDHDVISVVDAVSSLGGVAVPTDRIDVCLGASQKCFSAPPGLTICSVSDRAWTKIESFETDGLYTDLEPWRNAADEEWFPYTHLTANLYGLETAIDLLLEEGPENVFERHEEAATRCRQRASDLGLSLFPDGARSSPTVTALAVDGNAAQLQERMAAEHDVVLATGLGDLEDDVLRIGHMGHNARIDRVDRAMDALKLVLDQSPS